MEYSLVSYDDLGWLKKIVCNGRAYLTENFTYNVRSWMENITGTQFAENLKYYHNGNIQSMGWTMNGQKRTYTFAYDSLARLKMPYIQGSVTRTIQLPILMTRWVIC